MPRPKPTLQHRDCRFESLEDRRLLSHTPLHFSSTVTGRRLFYNNSIWDDPQYGFTNASAIAGDKTAYVPTGANTTTFANMSSYSKGLNGVMVELTGTHGSITASDFTFRTSPQFTFFNNSPGTWASAPAPLSVTLVPDTPASGTDRFEIIWADGAITNRYLYVLVEGNDSFGGSNTNTGLATSDDFFFGNFIGDVGTPEFYPCVSDVDEIQVMGNQGVTAPPTGVLNLFDFNRDGIVDGVDVDVARSNHGSMGWLALGVGPFQPTPDEPLEHIESGFATCAHATPSVSVGDGVATKSVVADDAWEMEFTIDVHPGFLPTTTYPITVHYATSDDTAVAGVDYEATSGDVTFNNASETSTTVTVPIIRVDEETLAVQPDKTFFIELFDPTNAILSEGESVGIGTIYDSVWTNRLLDPVAQFFTTAYGSPVGVSASAVTGDVAAVIPTITGPMAEQVALVFSSDNSASGVISFDATVPDGPGGLAYSASAILTITDPSGTPIDGGSAYFERAAGVSTDTAIRLATDYLGTLESGTYAWELTVTYEFQGEDPEVEVMYHGIHSIVNRTQSPYGASVWIAGDDQLIVQEEAEFDEDEPGVLLKPRGVTYVMADGTAVFFGYNATTEEYVTPRGYFLRLEQEAGGYTISTPQGLKKHFGADGLLQTVTDPSGNETTYQHNADKTLASIEDAFGRTVMFAYAGGKLDSITDADGRVTDIQINGVNLDKITSPAPGDGRPALETNTSLSGGGGSISLASGALVQLASNLDYATYNYDTRIGGQEWFFIDSAMRPFKGTLFGPADFITEETLTATIRQAAVGSGSPGTDTATMKVDNRGWVVEYTDFKGDTTKYERDDSGLVKSITLPGQSVPYVEFTYDDNGNMRTRTTRATTGTAALPEVVETWTYDPTWNVPDSYRDVLGNDTTYDIDPANGQVRSIDQLVYNELGAGPIAFLSTELFYTPGGGGVPAGLLHRVVGPHVVNSQPVETRYDWEVQGELLVQTVTEGYGTAEAIQRKYFYERDTMTLDHYQDERQFVTNYEYDNLDQLTKVLEPSPGGGAPRPTWEYRYYDDAFNGPPGLLKEIEDPRDNVTSYAYSFSYGGLSSYTVTEPKPTPAQANPTWIYTYDTMGRLFQMRDPRVNYTNYEYDENGRLERVKLPLVDSVRPEWVYHYDARGWLDFETDPKQNTTNYFYDERGQLARVLAPPAPGGSRPETKYEYDNRGLVTAVVDPMQRRTTSKYDSVGRLVRVEGANPASGDPRAVTTYDYDNGGNVRYVTAGAETPLEQTTEYQYDELNRLRAVLQPAPLAGSPRPTTAYTYWPTGQLNTLTDPNGNTTTWTLDDLGRVKTEAVSWSANARTFQYDAAGNLVGRIDRNGRAIGYAYDALNRLTAEKWFMDEAGMQGPPLRTISYGYDLAGNLITASDPAASYVYTPDELNRVNFTAITITSLPAVLLDNDYDANSNRTELYTMVGTTPDFQNHFVYDNLNRLTGLEQQAWSAGGNQLAHKQVGFTYNAAGQLAGIKRFNHHVADPVASTQDLAQSAYLYDSTGRLEWTNHYLDVGAPVFQSWDYDVLGRVAMYFNADDSPYLYEYGYDNNNQLTREVNGSEVLFEYDLGGNRTSADGVTVTPAAGNRITADGTYTYEYDAEGNLIRRTNQVTQQVNTFVWDHRNRLTEIFITFPGFPPEDNLSLAYEYDAFDRRVSRIEVTYTVGSWGFPIPSEVNQQKFIYDGDNVIFDFESVDGSPFELARRYLFGPAVDQVLAQENLGEDIAAAARVYWLLEDNLGTVRDIADNEGSRIQHYKYSAFGALLEGDATLTRYQYTGREFDASTGFQYNRGRWYDSTLGRFLNEDRTGFAGGDTNLYRYVWNSPTNGRDPTGTWAEPNVGGAAVRGVGQGALNTLNGVQDAIIGIYNLPNVAWNWTAGWIPGLYIGYVPSRDWARDALVYETDLGHSISKFAGGEGVITLATAGSTLVGRVQNGTKFAEYVRFRGQGFTPRQAKYLAEPYAGSGHHFPITQSSGKRHGIPEVLLDSPLNVLKPSGINRGRFYELHYRVDRSFNGARFPRSIGGTWVGNAIGLERYGTIGSMWHGTPPALRILFGAAGGGVGAAFEWQRNDP